MRYRHELLRNSSVLAAVVMAVCACGSSAPSEPDLAAAAHLIRIDELAAGKLDALPTGSQFARIVVFHQAAGQTFPSRKHQAGIMYVDTGMQRLTYIDGQSVDVGSGTAVYTKSAEHTHTNISAADSTWYFIALWASLQRGAPLVVAASQVAFETTEDIPSSTLRAGSYIETLRRVTLQAGGRSAAHHFGGLEVVFVLDGTLAVHVAGHASVRLTPGQGVYVAPATATQELAATSGPVEYLAYFVTLQGRTFETDLTSAPRG